MIEARNFEYLVAGLAASVVIIIGYLFYLVRRDHKLQRELARLRDMLADREKSSR